MLPTTLPKLSAHPESSPALKKLEFSEGDITLASTAISTLSAIKVTTYITNEAINV